jgi:hypothetical protein
MAEEKHESLDHRNFDKDKSEPYRDEVQQGNDPGLRHVLAVAMERQRQNQECKNSRNGNNQQHSQHHHAQVDAPVHAAACTRDEVINDVSSF